MTENFLKLMSNTKPQIQEAQRMTNRVNNENQDQSYTQTQQIKDKEKILKETRGEKVPYCDVAQCYLKVDFISYKHILQTLGQLLKKCFIKVIDQSYLSTAVNKSIISAKKGEKM